MNKSILIFVFIIFTLNSFCQRSPKKELLILHAGSLSVPFRQMIEAFQQKHADIEIRSEAAGSRACARKITELGSLADVFASADSEVIKTLLYPEFADYCIDFACNEMVLMYGEKSMYRSHISSSNWYQILQRPDVIFSHSDPHADPCGYRALLVMQLAEKYYRVPHLYDKLMQARSIKHIRPKETDLLALLETGELDYIFIYRSLASQHKGRYLVLPDEINLKSPALEDRYSQASVEITGARPGEMINRKGSLIIYGMTIPKTARSPGLGAQFIRFVLSLEGQRIMENNGQSVFNPPRIDKRDNLPKSLRELFEKEK